MRSGSLKPNQLAATIVRERQFSGQPARLGQGQTFGNDKRGERTDENRFRLTPLGSALAPNVVHAPSGVSEHSVHLPARVQLRAQPTMGFVQISAHLPRGVLGHRIVSADHALALLPPQGQPGR